MVKGLHGKGFKTYFGRFSCSDITYELYIPNKVILQIININIIT